MGYAVRASYASEVLLTIHQPRIDFPSCQIATQAIRFSDGSTTTLRGKNVLTVNQRRFLDVLFPYRISKRRKSLYNPAYTIQ